MVDAEKRLLGNALKDSDNQHFVLLSDRLVFTQLFIPYFGNSYSDQMLIMQFVSGLQLHTTS